ncbi:hypothetical protein [Metabacillus fastidiosus]|uniref:Uncharacterized protein n=1 Tax=Metabacillus fastidiosus TaxID=1458 RepID=A0ABU6NTT1_9BACI|nr:hypothetical protein [Metabacillus fastidiosus]
MKIQTVINEEYVNVDVKFQVNHLGNEVHYGVVAMLDSPTANYRYKDIADFNAEEQDVLFELLPAILRSIHKEYKTLKEAKRPTTLGISKRINRVGEKESTSYKSIDVTDKEVVLQKGEVILSKEEAEKYRNMKQPVNLTIQNLTIPNAESIDVDKIARGLVNKLVKNIDQLK